METEINAFVFLLILFFKDLIEIFSVSSSTSANTGVPPAFITAKAVALIVIAGIITSCFLSLIPKDLSATIKPDVPDDKGIANFDLIFLLNNLESFSL